MKATIKRIVRVVGSIRSFASRCSLCVAIVCGAGVLASGCWNNTMQRPSAATRGGNGELLGGKSTQESKAGRGGVLEICIRKNEAFSKGVPEKMMNAMIDNCVGLCKKVPGYCNCLARSKSLPEAQRCIP